MRPLIPALAVLVGLIASLAAAQDNPAAKPPIPTAEEICAHPPEAKVPEFEWKFEVSETKQEVSIRPEQVGQPEVMELRYRASVVLGNPDRDFRTLLTGGEPTRLDASGSFQDLRAYPNTGGFESLKPPKEFLESVVRGIPPEKLPSQEILSLLAREWPFFHFSTSFFPTMPDRRLPALQFSVAAPTVEQAKERAEGIAKVIAQGLLYRNQQEAVRQIGEQCRRLRQSEEELADAQKKIREQDELRKASEDLDREALRTLKMQQRLITVDIAGAVAKLDACKKALQPEVGKSVPPARADQVESLKVAAEIELVGLTARKRALDELVGKAEAQAAWQAEKEKLQESLRRLRIERSMEQQMIIQYWAAFQTNRVQLLEPIRISPIQWKTESEGGK